MNDIAVAVLRFVLIAGPICTLIWGLAIRDDTHDPPGVEPF